MEDRELADKIIELGVGSQSPLPKSCDGVGFYTIEDDGMCAELFVIDWRVAGALLESVDGTWCANHFDEVGLLTDYYTALVNTHRGRNKSLPRAITEACCEALSDE